MTRRKPCACSSSYASTTTPRETRSSAASTREAGSRTPARSEPSRIASRSRDASWSRSGSGAARSSSTSSSEGPLVRLTGTHCGGFRRATATCTMSGLILESERRGSFMAEHQGPRPLNRRELLAGAGTGILAIYLVGCGGSSSKLPTTASGTAPATTGGGATTAADGAGIGVPGPPAAGGTPGGKLVVVFQAEGNSNDPAIGYTGTSWDSICNLTFAPLYTYSENNDPQPHCAADLPEISADGLDVHHPAARRRDVPQRPPRGGRGLRLRLGSRARPGQRELGGELHLHDPGRQGALRGRRDDRHRHQGDRSEDDPGHAGAAGRHLPVRADAAVHGAGAEGGRRGVRQGLPGARRRQRPVQADHVRPGRPDDGVRPAHRATTGRACPTSTRSSTAGASTRACRSSSCRRATPTCSPTASTRRTWRRCGATRSRRRTSSSSRCSRSAG